MTVSTFLSSYSLLRFFLSVFASVTGCFVHAQLCNGSLGDPAVNITFGSGLGGNTGYTPTNAYSYIASSCPNDGYYTITNSTTGCFGNSWHTVNSDHTGGGAFMLVNASFTPGDFFVATVTDLCPNTSYEFAAWIMNVLNRNGIRPDITFRIETPAGIVLQQFSTGEIMESAQPRWQQYGFYFTTPVNNPVIVLRMTNNAPGGLGNDLALDDITFRPCGPIITSSITGSSDTVDICEGNTSFYNFTSDVSSAYQMPAFQWQLSTDSGKTWNDIMGANAIDYLRQPTGPGTYWYRMAVTEQNAVNIKSCRIASNYVVINVHANPFVNAGPDRIVFAGDSITLEGKVTGEDPVYYWDPPDYLNNNTIESPVATPPKDIAYTLYAESAFGCKSQDNVQVKVVAGIFVPSAFTPNNDGRNDKWRIPFLDPLLGATVKVYNRYGRLVYQASGITVEWDGTYNGVQQAAGTYVYHIRFKKGRKDMKGMVTIIR
ncbi:MAG: gliding motility-associated C-terminal domain-containing protein [Chitinophagaceae bacterium]|nr:gliding motility-associated C-terminal domain-containing protein [Chitinophagaceae bacterium]